MRQLSLCVPAVMAWLAATAIAVQAAEMETPRSFFGCCDGSAVVALDENNFVVASDEDSILRIYNHTLTNAPIWQHDFTGFLELARKSQETDLEGAARIGDVIYWISSHSRNPEGKERPNRQQLFATQIKKTTAGFELEPTGKPCKTLLAALLAESRLSGFKLTEASKLSPELPGALNIEGLAATPAGGLLIAFRNPVPAGKALLVTMENPAAVVQGKPPRFGEVVQLDLGGRGVRDITLAGGRYFLIAGGAAGKGHFSLFEWAGPGSEPILKDVTFGKFSPEGLAAIGGGPTVELLCTSDDGTRKIDGCDCKALPDPTQRRFRVAMLHP